MKYEVIKFKDDNIELDVNVSPKEDTVWLNVEQMSRLFQRDRSVISRHINSIYSEGEVDFESTCAKNAHMPYKLNRDYIVKLYNLDMIISVGYRVNSKRGIMFRRWANSILKDYLLKGYVISSRAAITKDNYIALTNKVLSLDKDVHEIKQEIEYLRPNSYIFYKGQYFESYAFIKELLKECDKKVTIIDPYMDINIFEYIKGLNKSKECICIYSSKASVTGNDFNVFKKEYFNVKSIINDDIHDRFIIFDDKNVYHIGTSLNYLGNKTFIINKIKDIKWIDEFINKINS